MEGSDLAIPSVRNANNEPHRRQIIGGIIGGAFGLLAVVMTGFCISVFLRKKRYTHGYPSRKELRQRSREKAMRDRNRRNHHAGHSAESLSYNYFCHIFEDRPPQVDRDVMLGDYYISDSLPQSYYTYSPSETVTYELPIRAMRPLPGPPRDPPALPPKSPFRSQRPFHIENVYGVLPLDSEIPTILPLEPHSEPHSRPSSPSVTKKSTPADSASPRPRSLERPTATLETESISSHPTSYETAKPTLSELSTGSVHLMSSESTKASSQPSIDTENTAPTDLTFTDQVNTTFAQPRPRPTSADPADRTSEPDLSTTSSPPASRPMSPPP